MSKIYATLNFKGGLDDYSLVAEVPIVESIYLLMKTHVSTGERASYFISQKDLQRYILGCDVTRWFKCVIKFKSIN